MIMRESKTQGVAAAAAKDPVASERKDQEVAYYVVEGRRSVVICPSVRRVCRIGEGT